MILHQNTTPHWRILDEQSCQAILEGAMTVLQRTGVLMLNPQAQQILRSAGCSAEGARFFISSALVEKALATTPRTFSLWGRDESKAIHIQPGRVHFGPGPTCTYFYDPYTGERRRSRKGDAALVARTCEGLENLDYVMSLSIFDDVPPSLSPLYEFAEMIAATRKPVVAWATEPEILAQIYQVALAVAGDEKAFSEKPSFAFFATYESPLRLADGQLGCLLWAAEHHIPAICLGGPTVGLESPPTGASALVLHLAAALAALTVVQLHKPGAPLMIGAALGAMDLRTARPAYGSPELSLYTAAAAELAHYLKLPFMGTGGASESKAVDAQASMEITLQVLISALSGADLVHDVGFLDCADIGSLELLVLADEAIAMAKRILRGIEVNPQTMMLEVIESVGPGAHFLSQPRSVALCKSEIWVPKLADRNAYAIWERNGSKSFTERLHQRLREILETVPEISLPLETQREIECILHAARNRV
ncbi:MAG: trimethylamine methyltransferase family protein [Anaerolineales bacterium]|nr:trimethylamine methyltransferase family protein [Anaerolineales bacterium]